MNIPTSLITYSKQLDADEHGTPLEGLFSGPKDQAIHESCRFARLYEILGGFAEFTFVQVFKTVRRGLLQRVRKKRVEVRMRGTRSV